MNQNIENLDKRLVLTTALTYVQIKDSTLQIRVFGLDRLQVQLQMLRSIIKATKEEEDNISDKRFKNHLKREAASLQP